jgi:SAM-dependent methyltransferase
VTTERLNAAVESVVACPFCGGEVVWTGDHYKCCRLQCPAAETFPEQDGKPILMDLRDRRFDLQDISLMSMSAATARKRLRGGLFFRIYKFLLPSNKVAEENARKFLTALGKAQSKPCVLVVGGGTRGDGTSPLYESAEIDLVSFDVYASANVAFIADAHNLPLRDGSVDGVWIQAVLEHVTDPNTVVAEIVRVLRPNGIVYAETPFMQQVHEGAHDFTRFSHSGHRWLFRDFEEISSGAVGGPGTVLLWAIRYAVYGATGSGATARAAMLPFFWLRIFDKLGRGGRRLDGASGTFFLGSKAGAPMRARDLPAYYAEHQRR